ncbi:putative conserved transmembrane protein rich in alanine, arginine and proline [Mycobacterium avium subsp. avium 2285 (R)]|nr:putative conserved transmembrane protein rich in alanine, arginine and proline [Mycobacterium avium subsp. avium 2285 (R)]
MGALDRVAGPRDGGQFRIGFHQSGGTPQARCNPGAVGRSRRRFRLRAVSPPKRRRPVPRPRPQTGLRPAAGPRDLGPARIRAHGGVPAAPRARLRAARPGRRRPGRAARRAERPADQPGNLVRHRPGAAPGARGVRGRAATRAGVQRVGAQRREPPRHAGGLGAQRSGDLGTPGASARTARRDGHHRRARGAADAAPPAAASAAAARASPLPGAPGADGAAVRAPVSTPPAAAATPPPPETPPDPRASPSRNRNPNPSPSRRAATGSPWAPRGSGCRPDHRAATGPAPTRSRRVDAGARAAFGRRRGLGWHARGARAPPPYAESGRRARSRHSAEYRDYGVRNFAPGSEPPAGPARARLRPPRPHRRPGRSGAVRTGRRCTPTTAAGAAAGRRAHAAARREPEPADPRRARDASGTGGQSVADLLARLQVQPSEGGRRRRREG